jgi:flavocytochrome c
MNAAMDRNRYPGIEGRVDAWGKHEPLEEEGDSKLEPTGKSDDFVHGRGRDDESGRLEEWHEEADVVIIGSGFAGLAAAMEAKKAGSSVVVIEKRKVRGGNSMISGGVVAAAGSPLQASQGVKDSPELMMKDMLKAGLHLNHPELVRIVAERSNETVQWTMNALGVRYDGTLTQWGGHSVPRSYTTHNKSGAPIIHRQLAELEKVGVHVKTRRCLTRILKDEYGSVKGVAFRDNYVLPESRAGTTRSIKARQAVVLATGGFGSDVSFRTAQDPRLTEETDSTNHSGATAEALIEALSIGAMPVHLPYIQLGPWSCPDEKGFGIGPWFAQTVAFQYGILVDPMTGERFMDEMSDRKIRADAIIETGHPCIGIADAAAAGYRADFLPRFLKRGVVKGFDTLQELAQVYDMPFGALKQTVERYNTFTLNREDREFGKPIQKDAQPLTHPPFYAIRVWPKVHHTMGGIQINSKAQVLDLVQRPIRGLYAAGEVVGGVHGACRLGSCSIVDCLVFGRIAGQNASMERRRD